MSIEQILRSMKTYENAVKRIHETAAAEGRAVTGDEEERIGTAGFHYRECVTELVAEGGDAPTDGYMQQSRGRLTTSESHVVDNGLPAQRSVTTGDGMTSGRGWRQVGTPDANASRCGFNSLSDFYLAVKHAGSGQGVDDRLGGLGIESAMTSGTGADGGFVIPPGFFAQLEMRAEQHEPWLALRDIFQVSGKGQGNRLTVPVLNDADRSSDEVAGIKLVRTGEAATLTSDQPILSMHQIQLDKAANIIFIPNELLEDEAVGLDAMLQDINGRAMAMLRSKDCLEGTGSGEPLGIFVSGDLHDVATTTGAGDILVADVAEMYARLEGNVGDSTAWIAHKSVFPALAGMRISTSAGESLVWSPNVVGTPQMRIYGIPVFFTDACPALNTVGDLILGNWNEYRYLFRSPVVDFSPHLKFDSDQTAFRFRLRDAGQPKRAAKLKDRQSYSQANFVRLATRT